MFNLRDFVKSGLIKAIGNMADYWVTLNAAGWYEQGVLTQEDLETISALIEAQYETEEAHIEGV